MSGVEMGFSAAVADQSDMATQFEELHRQAALLARRPQPVPAQPGQCAWCGSVTGSWMKFCDVDCRDDWERDHAKK